MKTTIAVVAVDIFILLLVGCGGGSGGNSGTAGGNSNPNAVPNASSIVGPWQIQATSTTNPGHAVLIEMNLSETGSGTLTSAGFVVPVSPSQVHFPRD